MSCYCLVEDGWGMHGCSLGFTSAIALVELPGFEPHEIETRSIINPRPPQRDSPNPALPTRHLIAVSSSPYDHRRLQGAHISITDTRSPSASNYRMLPTHFIDSLFAPVSRS